MPDSGDGQESMGNEAETLRRVRAEIEQCIDDLGKGLLPGSHFLYLPQHQLARYGAIRGSHYAVASAGSIFLTVPDGLLDLAPPVGLSWHWDSKQPQVQLLEDHAA